MLPWMLRSLAALTAFIPAAVHAYEIRCRWVERVGSTDIVIGGSGATLEASLGVPRRIRLQFGVFDDGAGPAPAGGFIGWNVGVLDVPHGINTRTPGRLSPFTLGTGPLSNGDPPLPDGDPFTHLTRIDATLGPQQPFWGCSPQGVPLPQPQPVIRGLNTFVSVYEITTNPSSREPYTVTASGNLLAAGGWVTVGLTDPPDCGDPDDPSDDQPGRVIYTPSPLIISDFSCTLTVSVAPCVADFNSDGRADSQDFFDFLGSFFSGQPAADINHDGTVTSEDFFAFVSAFFTGCP